MTTTQVGLYIGAWGMASAVARLIGSVMGGAVRDLATQASHNAVGGYVLVFGLEAALLFLSLLLLRQIDVQRFRSQASRMNMAERASLMNDL